MIKLIDKIERSKSFWFMLLIFILFFLLRLPSVIEPNWYGDEGIYQVLGMAINNGHILYADIWDNKPPLLYLTYALFQGDHSSVRFFSLIIGIITTCVFFALSKVIFKHLKASIVATTLFTLLFATPLIEGNIANAENFMLLPIILAALIIYRLSNNHTAKSYTLTPKPLLIAGLLLGVAFLFKIVAIFDFAAFFVFLGIMSLPERLTRSAIKKYGKHFSLQIVPYIGGFLLPLAITVLYFIFVHAFPDFIRATFSGMFGYVEYGNKLVVPHGLLIIKLLILAAIIGFSLIKRHSLSKPMLFIILWISFSLFNAFFSQRPYIHYMLVLVPSFCLLAGLVINTKTGKKQLQVLVLLLLVIATIFTTFKTFGFKRTYLYYQNAILFATGQKSFTSYQTFFDSKTPRDYQLASYIKMHTKPGQPILIWGNSAQIYALSHTLPINKYTVAYHTQQSNEGLLNTQAAIDKIQPKYVIILSESPGFPFQLDQAYINIVTLEKAAIYEKSL